MHAVMHTKTAMAFANHTGALDGKPNRLHAQKKNGQSTRVGRGCSVGLGGGGGKRAKGGEKRGVFETKSEARLLKRKETSVCAAVTSASER
jgi:hypothetical protein